MVDKKFFQPSVVNGWVIVVYELQSRFTLQAAQEMIAGLVSAAREVGKSFTPHVPPGLKWLQE